MRVLLATAVLVSLVACSNWRHDSSPSSSNAPPNSVTESEGAPMNPDQAATHPPTKLQGSPVPGESGVSNNSSTLSGDGGGGGR